MAGEITYDGLVTDSGKTLIAKVYSLSGTQIGTDVPLTEAGTTAIFNGDMPATGEGFYIFRVMEGNDILGRGRINWDGTAERQASTHSVADVYGEFTAGSNADAFKADVSAIPTNPVLTNDIRLDNLDAAVSSRSSHGAPDLSALATQSSVNAIPTNPVITSDSRLDNLDVAVSTRSSHAAPDLSGVAQQTTVASILADTNELQQNQGNWLTATGFSTLTASDIAGVINTLSVATVSDLDALNDVSAGDLRVEIQSELANIVDIALRLDVGTVANTYKNDNSQISNSVFTLTKTDNGDGTFTIAKT